MTHAADRAPRVDPAPAQAPARVRGFSLTELLVVIAIIVILIGILVPVVGRARDAAKRTASAAQIDAAGTAAQQFTNDNRRQPGYFTAADLADDANASNTGSGPALTAMENALLELAYNSEDLRTTSGDGYDVLVTPDAGDADKRIYINPGLAGTGSYLADDNIRPVEGQVNESGAAQTIPDLIDPFGMPVMLWAANEATNEARANPADGRNDTFAIISRTTGNEDFVFSWASNAGYLRAEALGERLVDLSRESLLGSRLAGASDDDRLATMKAILGSPAAPSVPIPVDTNLPASEDVFPTRALGTFIFHAAGPDFTHLGVDDGGLRGSGSDGLRMQYLQNFYSLAPDSPDTLGARLLDDNDQPTTIGVTTRSDDIIRSR